MLESGICQDWEFWLGSGIEMNRQIDFGQIQGSK